MSYATVMVHVDVNDRLGTHVDIAASLAERFGAALIGIAGGVLPVVTAPVASSSQAPGMEKPLERRRREFYETVGSRAQATEWRCLPEAPSDAVVHEARAADLVVVRNQRSGSSSSRTLDLGKVILNAGRPVLVVPETVSSFVPRRIALAWKDTREARRVARDALPLLHLAESVMVVEVLDERDGDEALQRVKDVAGYLARHGIEVVTERVRPSDVTVIGSLLRLIEDENIDLVVAGGYGRSPLGEVVFGGLTRELLAQSPICCLFSH